MYNQFQQEYANICGEIYKSFANKRPLTPTPDETKVFNEWYVRQPDLLRAKDAHSVNAGLFWCCTLKYNSPVTPEFLDSCNRSAELAPLLLRPAPQVPQVLTAAQRADAEEGLARLEPLWRGAGRDSSGSPYTVRYDTPDNLDRMIQRVNDEGVVVTDATLLLAFKYLLAEKQLTPIAREQRKTHDAPATHQSIREDQQADAHKHVQKREDVQAIRKLRAEFSRDYDTVANYRGTGPGGVISHAATFSGQQSGFAELRKRYDGKFTDELAPKYDQLMADLEKAIQKHSPSGGAIRVYDADAKATVTTGSNFADVMTQLPKSEPSKRTNRDAFGEGALPADAPFPPLR
jgi:hypothetical protein